MKLIEADEAMRRCAVAMETMVGEDLACPDVRAIYQAAAALHNASERLCASREFQIDPRIHVPDWLMNYGGPASSQGEDSR
jgi:hypothetical protein